MTTPLILDVDTGVDDAMAIALATRLSSHQLIAVTTVAGNVGVELATGNTLRTLEYLGFDVPVYRGMLEPLVRPLHTATTVHGNDGLGGWKLKEASRHVEVMSAPEAIIHHARANKGNIDGAFVGPLTNLAVALKLEPELAGWFRHVAIMGGAFFNPGNVTPHAEFNAFVDPEAAGTMARSSLNVTWIGLDVTHQTSLSRAEWNQLEGERARPATLVREVSRQSFEVRDRDRVYLHDPLAVAVVSRPDLVDCVTGQVLVETDHFARGRTRLAREDSVSRVAESVDASSFMEMFSSMLELQVNHEGKQISRG